MSRIGLYARRHWLSQPSPSGVRSGECRELESPESGDIGYHAWTPGQSDMGRAHSQGFTWLADGIVELHALYPITCPGEFQERPWSYQCQQNNKNIDIKKCKKNATHLHLAVSPPQDRLPQLAALHCSFCSFCIKAEELCQRRENRKAGQSQEGKVCTIGTLSVRLSLYNIATSGNLTRQETCRKRINIFISNFSFLLHLK